MASIKVKLFEGKKLRNGEHPIVIQVIRDRKRKIISLGHSCSINLWDYKQGIPKKKHPNFKELSIKIGNAINDARKLQLNLENEKKDFTLNEFEQKFRNKNKKLTVLTFIDLIIQNLIKANKIGNADVYKYSRRELIKFMNGADFTFSEIDQSFLRKFEMFFQERGLMGNSIGLNFRTLRSIYNKAISEGYAKKSEYPFYEFKISKFNTETQRRAIQKTEISKIIKYHAKKTSITFHSKNYFLFSFYTRGMNFIDMAKLTWDNIIDDRIIYERSKTGKKQNVKLLMPALKILNYYKKLKKDKYVFPILNDSIHKTPLSINYRVEKMTKITNAGLKEIASDVGIKVNLTTYVARHSWATILKHEGVSTPIISEGLGHLTEETTQVYLDSFGNEILDNANEVLLNI
ncbi:MAG TPA: site-specific integrase [Bacteroidia bacterium]|nr:site-specific integrase [Bacteroidia bacterium]